ncbi:MAG: nucleotidyltransferase domain-containing protein [Deltaproteobacteria bacterium]|nr:nucleotidyltransferase domain-containing protein [Deltaproteobacteria bacterium]
MKDWRITKSKVKAAVKRIIEVSRPRRVFLFGSYVQGTQNINSDVDILVVVGDTIANCRKEGVRIRKALGDISMPMDILVVRYRDFKKLAHIPGLIYETIVKEGKVVYEAAA